MSLSKLGSSRLQPFQGASMQDFEVVGSIAPTEVRESTDVAPDLHKQVGQLNSKLNVLRDEQRLLRASLAAKRDESNQLNVSIDDLTEQLRLAKCEIESQKFNIAQAEDRAKVAEEKANKASKRAEKAEGRLDSQNSKSDRLDREVQDLRSKLEKTELDLNQAEMERDVNTKHLRELTETYTAFKQQVTEDKASASAYAQEELKNAVEATKNSGENPLTAVVENLEATVEALRAQIAVLDADKKQAEDNLAELRVAIETKKEVTEARIQQSVEAVAAAKASEDRLAHMLQVEERRAKHMVDELRNRVGTLQSEVTKSSNTVESQKIQITDLTQQASRSEAECEKLQSSNIAFEEETKRALESETAAKEDKALDTEKISELQQEVAKLKRKLFRSTSQALAGKREKKEAEKAKMDKAMSALITSRQEEYERSEAEKRKRLNGEEIIKGLKKRVAYLTMRVDDTTSTEVARSEELDVLRAILALREQHIEKLRHQLAAEKWRNDQKTGQRPRHGEPINKHSQQVHPAILDFLVGHTEDWLAADAAQLIESRKQDRDGTLRRISSHKSAMTIPAPIEAVLSRASDGTGGSDLVWSVTATELRGSELINSLGLREMLTTLQENCTPLRHPGEPADNRIFADIARRVASIATQWRGIEEWAAAEVGLARKAAAVAEARAVRLARAGKEVVSAVETERTAKQKSVLKFVASVLANGRLEAKHNANTRVVKEDKRKSLAPTFITQDEEIIEGARGDNILLTQPLESTYGGDASGAATSFPTSNVPGSIRSLRLAESCIDDELCHGIVTLLMGGEVLTNTHSSDKVGLSPAIVEEIVLRGNNITDVGARALAILVKYSPGLQRLDIRGNRISARGRAVLVSAARSNEQLAEVEIMEDEKYGHTILAQRVIGKSGDTEGETTNLVEKFENSNKEDKESFQVLPLSIDVRQNKEGRDAAALVTAAVRDFEKALTESSESMQRSTAAIAAPTLISRTQQHSNKKIERKSKRSKKPISRKSVRGRANASKITRRENDENYNPEPTKKNRTVLPPNFHPDPTPWEVQEEPRTTAPAAFKGIDQAIADSLLDEHIYAMERELKLSRQPVQRPRAAWLNPRDKRVGKNDNSMKRSRSAPAAKRNDRGGDKVRGPSAVLEERRIQEQLVKFAKSANRGKGPKRTSLRREVELQRQINDATFVAGETNASKVRHLSSSKERQRASQLTKKGEVSTSQRIYQKYADAMSPPRRSKEEEARIAKIAGF